MKQTIGEQIERPDFLSVTGTTLGKLGASRGEGGRCDYHSMRNGGLDDKGETCHRRLC